MMQHDLLVNPNPRARSAFPFLVVLQANVVEGKTTIVAPLTPDVLFAYPGTRIRPIVRHEDNEYSVLMLLMTGVPRRLLRDPVGSIAQYRDDLTRAIDWLFCGI